MIHSFWDRQWNKNNKNGAIYAFLDAKIETTSFRSMFVADTYSMDIVAMLTGLFCVIALFQIYTFWK